MYSEDKNYYVVLRAQECGMQAAIKRCKRVHGGTFNEVFSIMSYENPRNLLHRFKDHVRNTTNLKGAVTFHRTSFKTTLQFDEIKSVFMNLEKSFQERVNSVIV